MASDHTGTGTMPTPDTVSIPFNPGFTACLGLLLGHMVRKRILSFLNLSEKGHEVKESCEEGEFIRT